MDKQETRTDGSDQSQAHTLIQDLEEELKIDTNYQLAKSNRYVPAPASAKEASR